MFIWLSGCRKFDMLLVIFIWIVKVCMFLDRCVVRLVFLSGFEILIVRIGLSGFIGCRM